MYIYIYIGLREKHGLVSPCTYPSWGSNMQTFGVQDEAPTNLATWPGQKPCFKTHMWLLVGRACKVDVKVASQEGGD